MTRWKSQSFWFAMLSSQDHESTPDCLSMCYSFWVFTLLNANETQAKHHKEERFFCLKKIRNSCVKERDTTMHYQQMRYERPIDWGTKWVLCRIKHQSNINGNCTFSIRPFGTWNLFVIYSQLHFAQQLDVDGFHFASLRSALSAQLICAPYLFWFVCVFFPDIPMYKCASVK